jgi:hypothetical protein
MRTMLQDEFKRYLGEGDEWRSNWS